MTNRPLTDYLRLGSLMGAAVALVGHFATRVGQEGSGAALLVWMLTGGALGALVGLTIYRANKGQGAARARDARASRTTSSEPLPLPTARKFYAVSREPSSTELRALMVDAPAIPGNVIGSRLQLIVERYDAYARVALSEGSLLEYPVEELLARAQQEATDRAPVSSSDVSFIATYFRSEGPLNDAGRSPFGWTFAFVDGTLGIHADVLVGATDMLLVYRTAVSYPKGTEVELVSPQVALATVREAFPTLSERPLYLRVNLPATYHLYSPSPLTLVSLDETTGEVIAPIEQVPAARAPSFGPPASVAELVRMITEKPDHELVPLLLDRDADTLKAVASQLFDLAGPVVVDELIATIRQGAREASPGTEVMLHVLARVPSGLSMLALHQLCAEELPAELEDTAMGLFDRRRRRELDVFPDPIEPLDFYQSRRLLGWTQCLRVPLRSTFDPEADLLPPLAGLGLRATRVRLLSGDTELFLTAYLRSGGKRTEAQLSSSPLPVPCHILRVVGADADTVADLVAASEVHYPIDEMVEDVLSRRPTAVHRGALYMAALGINRPETFDALTGAIDRHRSNTELRRACIAALIELTHPDVVPYLRDQEDPVLGPFARDLLERRELERRREQKKRATTGAWEREE